jgi:hypothetical protein
VLICICLVLKGSPELSKEEVDTLFNTPPSQISVFAKSVLPKSISNSYTTKEAFKLVETQITLLHKLSVDIRRAINRYGLANLPKLFYFDTEHVIIREQKKDGSNSQIVIESVCVDVGAEFEEFVRKALTHRWLQYRSPGEDGLTKEQHNYRQILLERCVSTVSTRRRQLEYFRAHQNRLEQNDRQGFLFRPSGQQTITPDNSQTATLPNDKVKIVDARILNDNDIELNQASDMPPVPSSYSHDRTVVSEFVVANFKPSPASSAPSSSASTIAAAGFRSDGPFVVPQPPVLDGGEKEKVCPYCFLVVPARTFSTHKKAKRWERHLLKDLQPYVCLFSNCASPGMTYSSFGAWKSHHSKPHYHSWQCSFHKKDDNSKSENDIQHPDGLQDPYQDLPSRL